MTGLYSLPIIFIVIVGVSRVPKGASLVVIPLAFINSNSARSDCKKIEILYYTSNKYAGINNLYHSKIIFWILDCFVLLFTIKVNGCTVMFFCHFTKANNFHDFMLASLVNVTPLQRVYSLKKQNDS